MIKKIVMVLMATAIFTSMAMAQSGFEFAITFPIGTSISMPIQKIKINLDAATIKFLKETAYKTTAGFEWGATLQVGYMFAVGNDIGVSALLDMGYHRDVFAFSSKKERQHADAINHYKKVDVKTSFEFDTLQIGVLPKFRIKNIAIGLGGGVKIPLGGDQYDEESSYNVITGGEVNADKLETYVASSFTKKNIDDSFKSPIIPYIKVTFDYMLAIDKKTSLTFGAYVGYDFFLEEKIGSNDYGSTFRGFDKRYDKVGFSAIDIGVQIGIRFGPSAT